jgi:restriction system protein
MLFWLLLVSVLAVLVKSPWFKGVVGEAWVNLGIWLFLSSKDYRLIRNVTLPTGEGTTQIDHIVVSRFGVFVIETKNMSGWIFGNPHQKVWTQKLYRESYKFQNPLHQNYKHTKALEEFLGIAPETIFSVVVFIGDSTFKTPMPENVMAGGYIRYIRSKNLIRLPDAEVDRIAGAIQAGRLTPSLQTHRDHVRHLQDSHAGLKAAAERACPRCGRPMVLRTASQGANAGREFWGCSGFPKCRHVTSGEADG